MKKKKKLLNPIYLLIILVLITALLYFLNQKEKMKDLNYGGRYLTKSSRETDEENLYKELLTKDQDIRIYSIPSNKTSCNFTIFYYKEIDEFFLSRTVEEENMHELNINNHKWYADKEELLLMTEKGEYNYIIILDEQKECEKMNQKNIKSLTF